MNLPKAMRMPRRPRTVRVCEAWYYVNPNSVSVYIRGAGNVELSRYQLRLALKAMDDYRRQGKRRGDAQ